MLGLTVDVHKAYVIYQRRIGNNQSIKINKIMVAMGRLHVCTTIWNVGRLQGRRR